MRPIGGEQFLVRLMSPALDKEHASPMHRQCPHTTAAASRRRDIGFGNFRAAGLTGEFVNTQIVAVSATVGIGQRGSFTGGKRGSSDSGGAQLEKILFVHCRICAGFLALASRFAAGESPDATPSRRAASSSLASGSKCEAITIQKDAGLWRVRP